MKVKAIVLSYDKNHVYVDHMIHQYNLIWQEHPFQFIVPYNRFLPKYLKNKYGEKIEFVKSPASIKQTVLQLLKGMDDNEWVYWCIDDKYLIDAETDDLKELVEWVTNIKENQIAGASLARARKFLDKEYIDENEKLIAPNSQDFYLRKYYNQFWLHQFFRVKVIREVFESFPDRDFYAKEMDYFIEGKETTEQMKFYVCSDNKMVFGESACRGRITKSAIKSIKKAGIDLPSDFITKRLNVNMKIGKLSWKHKIKRIKTINKVLSFFN